MIAQDIPAKSEKAHRIKRHSINKFKMWEFPLAFIIGLVVWFYQGGIQTGEESIWFGVGAFLLYAFILRWPLVFLVRGLFMWDACSNCNTFLNKSDNVCPNCKMELVPDEEKSDHSVNVDSLNRQKASTKGLTWKCSCGEINMKSAQECRHCGRQRESEQ